jgi:hypothetical protein
VDLREGAIASRSSFFKLVMKGQSSSDIIVNWGGSQFFKDTTKAITDNAFIDQVIISVLFRRGKESLSGGRNSFPTAFICLFMVM